MNRAIFAGPLDDTLRALWRHGRQGRAGNTLVRLPAPAGQLVWGHPAADAWIALGMALAAAGLAWGLGGGRFERAYWPVWLLAAAFALAASIRLFFRESFTLDSLARRWHYRRGWGGALHHETDAFDGTYGLAGLCLRQFRRPLPNNDSVWALRLEFADGVRHIDLGGIRFETQFADARAEAESVAQATGLPLRILPLEETPHAS